MDRQRLRERARQNIEQGAVTPGYEADRDAGQHPYFSAVADQAREGRAKPRLISESMTV